MSLYSDIIQAHSSLVSYWRLGESSGTNAVDAEGVAAGTYAGTPTLAQPGAIVGDPDTSVLFDGSDDRVTASNAALNLETFTMECWWKPTNITGDYIILSWGENVAGKRRSIYQQTGTGALGFSGFAANVMSSAVGTTTAFKHVAVTKTAGHAVIVYVNGAEVASGTPALNAFVYGSTHIGQNPAAAERATGTIDEVAIYNAVLSPGDVQQHFLAGIGALGPTDSMLPLGVFG